ncbi:flagellar associated protein [Dorcoceras hygrometricum]|uniref:Flagellar associated protein n=1 Tax=Dorcoceras hygrometricum TaxID=472368 RepID=A0A2Z7AL05_9LAMI|nr:flagellar associated protein [Dorcoceras hygrometricum]
MPNSSGLLVAAEGRTGFLLCGKNLTAAASTAAPPCRRRRDRTCSDRRVEEIPFMPNSSGLLVQADEGVVFPIMDLIKEDLPPPTLKSQIPCEFGWSQAPRRQQGIQLANFCDFEHIFGLTHRIMVKRLATSPHDPLDSIGYPCTRMSGESSTMKHRLLHASGPHPTPSPGDPN